MLLDFAYFFQFSSFLSQSPSGGWPNRRSNIFSASDNEQTTQDFQASSLCVHKSLLACGGRYPPEFSTRGAFSSKATGPPWFHRIVFHRRCSWLSSSPQAIQQPQPASEPRFWLQHDPSIMRNQETQPSLYQSVLAWSCLMFWWAADWRAWG